MKILYEIDNTSILKEHKAHAAYLEHQKLTHQSESELAVKLEKEGIVVLMPGQTHIKMVPIAELNDIEKVKKILQILQLRSFE